MTQYTLFTTINRANGTDYDMDTREVQGSQELSDMMHATVLVAEIECKEESEFTFSSITFTVVPH